MSGSVITAAPEDRVSELAVTMRTEHVHRVVIVDGDALVGIVTAFDLLRLLEDQ